MSDLGPPDDPLGIALDVAGRLAPLGIAYAITGSLSSTIHGEPRATLDVDLIIDVNAESSVRVSDALLGDYYIDIEHARREAARGGSYNAIHVTSAIKVDFFVVGVDAFERERLKRRVSIPIPDGPIDQLWVDAAECTVLRKLEWFRRGGHVSDRQWRDVLAVLRIKQGLLNEAFLDQWARALGVADLLDRARDAAY
jgi:hypothetical protein